MAKDPARVAQKWANNLVASTEEIRAGVNAVSVSPTEKAAASRDKWLARIQASADKWQSNLRAVGLAEWKNAMLQKGIPNISTGVPVAIPKFQQFMTALINYQESTARPAIANIPPTTLQNNIQRMTTWVTAMAKFRFTRGK